MEWILPIQLRAVQLLLRTSCFHSAYITMAAVVVQAPVSALQDSFKALELSYGDKQFAKQQLSGEEKQASGAARR